MSREEMIKHIKKQTLLLHKMKTKSDGESPPLSLFPLSPLSLFLSLHMLSMPPSVSTPYAIMCHITLFIELNKECDQLRTRLDQQPKSDDSSIKVRSTAISQSYHKLYKPNF